MADTDTIQGQPQSMDPRMIAALVQAVQGNSSGLTGGGSVPPPSMVSTGQPSPQPQQVDPRLAIIQAAQGNSQAMQPPAQGGGVLPPSNPFDISQIVSKVAGLPQYAQPTATLEGIGSRERDIEDKFRNLPIPQTGYKPPPAHGFLPNLWRALKIMGASTDIGRSIQNTVYGPGIRDYNAQRAILAEQLATLKQQEAIPTEELRSITGLTNAGAMSAYRGGILGVRQMSAETQRIAAQHHAAHDQVMEQVASGRLTEEQKRTLLIHERNSIEDRKNMAMLELIKSGQQLHWDEATMANERSLLEADFNKQSQEIIQHPLLNMLGLTPTIPSAVEPVRPKSGGNATPSSPSNAGSPKPKKNTSKPVGNTVKF